MTFAQFKRMKRKYQIRLIVAGIVLFLLFIGLLLGVSALFNAVRTQLNTKQLPDVTSVNILHQNTFSTILKTAGQDDPEQLLVMDSRVVCSDQGAVLEFDMNLANLVSSRETDYWLIHMRNDKTYMRRTSTEGKNGAALQYTKLTFAKYFPTLSRINAPEFVQKLQDDIPVGSGGRYIFEDSFSDNLNPQVAPYLETGYAGFQVSSKGNSVGALQKSFVVTPEKWVPYVLSVEAVNEKRSKPNRVILLDEEKKAVVLFEVGPWANV